MQGVRCTMKNGRIVKSLVFVGWLNIASYLLKEIMGVDYWAAMEVIVVGFSISILYAIWLGGRK